MGHDLIFEDNGGSRFHFHETLSGIKVPKNCIENQKLRQTLYAVIKSFDFKEQRVINLYYWIGFPVEEIAELIQHPTNYVLCTLGFYSEKFKLKLATVNVDNDTAKETARIEDLFEAEHWERYESFLRECQDDPEYHRMYGRSKSDFLEILHGETATGFG